MQLSVFVLVLLISLSLVLSAPTGAKKSASFPAVDKKLSSDSRILSFFRRHRYRHGYGYGYGNGYGSPYYGGYGPYNAYGGYPYNGYHGPYGYFGRRGDKDFDDDDRFDD